MSVIGNKNAVGNNGGRPTPSIEEKIQIGRNLVEYVKTHPDCLTIPMAAIHMGYSSFTFICWSDIIPEFLDSYKEAKDIIGLNRLYSTMNKEENKPKLDISVYRGTLWNYDSDIKNDKREELRFIKSLDAANQGNAKIELHIGNESAAYIAGQVQAASLPKENT